MSSNKSRDRQRLVALDIKIQELEYLYTLELEKERIAGKRTLLLSRAFKNRIKTLEQQRRGLAKTLETLNIVQSNYMVELAYREAKVTTELSNLEAKKKELEAEILNCRELEQLKLLNPALEIDYSNIEFITAEIPKITARIRNYQRAVNNWVSNGKNIAPRTLSDFQRTLVKELDSDIDMSSKESEIIVKTPESILGKDAKWDIQVTATNNATFDLITPPSSPVNLVSEVVQTEVNEIPE